jgi:outer membrane protein assembly factor BamB
MSSTTRLRPATVRRRWLRPTVVGVLGAWLVAGCGGGDAEDGGASSSATTNAASVTTTVGTPATVEPSRAAGPGSECPAETGPALAAYDIATGEEQWATCGDPTVQRFPTAVTDDSLYVVEHAVSAQGPALAAPELVTLDADDGTERWRVPLAGTSFAVPGPFLGAGVIVVEVDDGGPAIAGIDAVTGAPVWRIDVAEHQPRLVAVTERMVVVRDDTIVDPGPRPVETDDRGQFVPPTFTFQLRGHDRISGALVWSADIERGPDDTGMVSGGVVGDTVVLVPGPFRIDAMTGQVGWQVTDGTLDTPIGAVADGVVLAGTLGEPTTALDLATGQTLWTQPGSAPYAGSFAVGDGAVYLTDRNDLFAYDLASGAERWRRPNVPEDYSWPWHVADDTLFTMWWNLEARSTEDGSVKWRTDYPNGDEPTGSTPRMMGIVTNTSSAIVAFYAGTLGGD